MTKSAGSTGTADRRVSRIVPDFREGTLDRASGAPSPRLRILIVDDDVDAARSLARALALKSHEVRTVFDGNSALEEAKSFQPDAVILDIAMPNMNGYDVCRRLRGTPHGGRPVIVALTGLEHKKDRLLSRFAGF